MATSGGTGQGPGTKPVFKKSWVQVVGGSLPSSWKKNILEIVLEKDDRGAFYVSDADCSHLLTKLGIDPRPGALVEAIQICPTGRGVIFITFKQGVNLEQFSRYDVLQVTRSGVRAVHVKPAGKRDVIVTIKGLHPNTKDEGVIDYLNKYGKVVTSKVVYGTFGEGPLKGVRNGDRSYKMEVKADTNIGTYHAIDGQRVTLRYPGQMQTCARCFEPPISCKGGAVARRCEAAQGEKVEFSDFILRLWQEIGYTPGEVEIAAVYDEYHEYDDSSQKGINESTAGFTPEKQVSEPSKFSGVCIKQIPKDTDHGDIMEFLVKAGMPESLRGNVEIKNNGSVSLKNADNAICRNLIANIHNKVEFGKKLFCNGFIALTPDKGEQGTTVSTPPPQSRPVVSTPPPQSGPMVPAASPPSGPSTPASPCQPGPGPASTPPPQSRPVVSTSPPQSGPTVPAASPLSESSTPASPSQPGPAPTSPDKTAPAAQPLMKSISASSMLSLPGLAPPDFSSSNALVRRYSLSLTDKPPACSIAADILNTRKNILSEIRDLNDQLSEFGSCVSEQSDSSGDESFKEVKSHRSKRKAGKSPLKSDEQNKKPALVLDWYENCKDGLTQ